MIDGLQRLGIEGVDRRSRRWFWRCLGPLLVAGLMLLGLRQLGPESLLDRPLLLLGLIVPTTVIGMMAAAIWWGRRQERSFLWLAVASVSGCLYCLPRLIDHTQLPVPAAALSVVALAGYISASEMLGLHLFARDMPRLQRLMAAVVTLLTLFMVTASLVTPAWLPQAATVAYGLLVVYGFTLNLVVYVWEHLRRPTPLSFVMQVAAHCMGASILWEAALLPGGSLWQTPAWFLLMAPIAVVVSISWLLQRFGQALGESERWAATLESRVAAREAEIADSYEQLKAAEKARTVASERERLFRDMHDGMGGTLVLALSRLLNEGAGQTPVARALQSALDDLRLILSSLSPEGANLRSGLADLHARLVDLGEDQGVRLRLDLSGMAAAPTLKPGQLLQLMRVVQEAVVNALRHGQPSQIVVRAVQADQAAPLLLQVDDDGAGFDPEQPVPEGHYGLANQRQRAREIGATLQFLPLRPGTRVELMLPP